jgi:antitoxin HicB
MSNHAEYPITIHPLPKEGGGGFLAKVPDLPGCIADGETVEEALHEIVDAVDAWIKTATEFGDPVPAPSVASNFSGQWRMRVPKHLHAALALQAKEEGVSLNMLAATLLAEGIGKRASRRDAV